MKRVNRIIGLVLTMCCICVFSVAPVFAGTSYEYRAVKVKPLSKQLSTSCYASAEGGPGVTISISTSKSVSRSYSCTTNVSVKAINTAIGWSQSTSDSVNVTKGGSWKVPAKANGKAVKKGILKGYVYLDRYEYKIQRRTVNTISRAHSGSYKKYGSWTDWKKGCIAYKARLNDVSFRTSYVYK